MKIKRFLCLLLAAALALGAVGCAPAQDSAADQQQFDAYLQTLPPRMMDASDLNINYTFAHPEKFGFAKTTLELPLPDEQKWKDDLADTEKLLGELESYDDKKLDDASKLTLSILEDSCRRQLTMKDDFYLASSYLGSFIGFQAELPMLLTEFNIDSQQDLDSYFHLLATAKDAFARYADFEKQRQQQGVGMCQAILDKVMEQCDNFVAGGAEFMIDPTNAKIDAAEFLSADEKTAAKEKNRALLTGDFVGAYRSLKQSLSEIKASDKAQGLWSQPGGKEYYAALLSATTGVDMTPEQVQTYLQSEFERLVSDWQSKYAALQQSDPDKAAALEQNFTADWGDYASAEEALEHLREATASDFPAVPQLSYGIRQVAESMKDNFSPAAYLQSRIDAPADNEEVIYINGDYSSSLFPTLAHEGYPGHMYQHCYFKSLGLPTVRYMIDYNGYSEGWATYVENSSWKWLPAEDQAVAELVQLNGEIGNVIIALSDIGVHYTGWTEDDFDDFVKQYFSLDDDTLHEQYLLILETPTNYLQYFLTGSLYEQLCRQCEEAMGSDFSAQGFNKVMLETGPAPLSILTAQLDSWSGGRLAKQQKKDKTAAAFSSLTSKAA